jgi:hypothetical protein
MNVLELPVVEQYLQSVSNALIGADPDRRNEVLEQLADHILAATADDAGGAAPGTSDPEARAREVIERLGSPSEIALAAGVQPFGVPTELLGAPAAPTYTMERIAVVAFAVSWLIPLIAWIAGFILLWMSSVWTMRQKVVCSIATLPLVLGPTVPMALLLIPARNSSTVGGAATDAIVPGVIFVLAIVAPIAALIWLGRSITLDRRRRAAS